MLSLNSPEVKCQLWNRFFEKPTLNVGRVEWLTASLGWENCSELWLTTSSSYCAMDEFSAVPQGLQKERERERKREGGGEVRDGKREKEEQEERERERERERRGSLFEEQAPGSKSQWEMVLAYDTAGEVSQHVNSPIGQNLHQ